MAKLTTAQRTEVAAEFMRRLSSTRTSIPAQKNALLALVGFVDDELEQAETNLLARIPVTNPGRAWLMANPKIARAVIEEIAQKRREEL